jgi:hypothetical protein
MEDSRSGAEDSIDAAWDQGARSTRRLTFGAGTSTRIGRHVLRGSTKPKRWVKMATLFRIGGYRIVVYSNDHPPSHVHAIGEGRARFELGGSPADVRLTEQIGVSVGDLRRIAREIIARHAECLACWSEHHGD